jgi:hypothetical protein
MMIKIEALCRACDTPMYNTVAIYQYEDMPLAVPFDIASGNMFICPNCGLKHYIGDIDMLTEDEL